MRAINRCWNGHDLPNQLLGIRQEAFQQWIHRSFPGFQYLISQHSYLYSLYDQLITSLLSVIRDYKNTKLPAYPSISSTSFSFLNTRSLCIFVLLTAFHYCCRQSNDGLFHAATIISIGSYTMVSKPAFVRFIGSWHEKRQLMAIW